LWRKVPLIDDSHKTAWVFGYLKAYFDLYISMGTDPERLSNSMHFLTERVLDRLKITDDKMLNSTIDQLDHLDLELTIAKVIKENTDDSTKSFSITL
jgi:hypothetical protein